MALRNRPRPSVVLPERRSHSTCSSASFRSAALCALALAAIAPRTLAQGAQPQAPTPAATPGAQAPQPNANQTNVGRVRSGGARLFSLADVKAQVLCELPAGTPLRVRGQNAGWLQVEPAGGFPAWVAGAYLAPGDRPDQAVVQGDRVNLRPAPSKDAANSFPVATLERGTRLDVLARQNPALPLAEDWVRVNAPAGASAWLRAEQTEPMPVGADFDAQWNASRAARAVPGSALVGTTPSNPGATPGGAGATLEASSTPGAKPAASANANPDPAQAPQGPGSRALLERAQQLLESVRGQEQPDFAAVRAAFEAVLAHEGETAQPSLYAQGARKGLEAIAAMEAALAQRGKLAEERARFESELPAKRAEIRAEAEKRNPLAGLYDAHGTLVRRAGADGRQVWWLSFAQKDVCEIACSSGRYDLELYAGANIGVRGALIGGSTGLPRIDIQRIEVLIP